MSYSLYAEPDCEDTPLARRVARKTGASVVPGCPETDDLTYTSAKRTIYLKNHKGEFLKPCPGTSRHTCCLYNFLNIATNCPMDCTYCILQDYLGAEPITIHCNTDAMMEELETAFGGTQERFFRVGTGELTDSLAIDELTGYSLEFVPFFSRFDNAILELKTKTAFVDNLLDLDHGRHTIIAWSLNARSIAESEETGAAPIAERIRAARRCQDAGYPLAFHFDPIIEHPGWQEGYRDTIQMLFDSGVSQESIAWVSLGCLRFMPRVGEIVAERFPRSIIRTGEFVTGKDGKRRYFKPVRIEMYSELAQMLRKGWPDAFVYFCMESRSVWNASLGWAPTNTELSTALDNRARSVESQRA